MIEILIAEDDSHINTFLSELLTRSGYAVTQAFSGSEALLCLESKTFDLVLLDLMLPGKSGTEVLSEIREGAGCADGREYFSRHWGAFIGRQDFFGLHRRCVRALSSFVRRRE